MTLELKTLSLGLWSDQGGKTEKMYFIRFGAKFRDVCVSANSQVENMA